MKKLTFLFLAVMAFMLSLTTVSYSAEMIVVSSAIDKNGVLADKYGYNDKTQLDSKGMPITSFPFEIKNAPKGTKSYAVFLEDKDAFPVSKGFSWIHWAAANITDTKVLENASKNKPKFVQGMNSWWSSLGGSRDAKEVSCYGGPAPYDGKEHIYEMHVYALDTKLDLKNGFLMNEMFRKMEGHVLGKYTLKFKYQLKK